MTRIAPDHWLSLIGPSNWFEIWYPPTWQVVQKDGGTQLVSRGGGSSLALHCYWMGDQTGTELRFPVEPGELFPRSRHVRSIELPSMPYESVGLEGDVAVARGPHWWDRLLLPKTWRRWQVWAVRQGSVCLVAIYVGRSQRDPDGEAIARMILGTLQFADDPADPPDRFAERVLELARTKFPLLDFELVDASRLRMGEASINLFNFYRAYATAPGQFEKIVLPALTTVVQIQEWGQEQTDPGFEQVRERILPMLYPESVWRECFPNFVGEPWIAGLAVLYVVDESNAYWYIRQDLVQTWNLGRDELHRLALTNLARHFSNPGREMTLVGDEESPRLLTPAQPDAYNASRLLSDSFHSQVRELLGRQFAVGIPNRDLFIAVSLDSGETIEHIRRQVAEDFSQKDHPLCERLLLVSDDGVSEYHGAL